MMNAFCLLIIGSFGVFLSRKNVILTIMSLEVMLLSVNFNLVFFSTYLDDVLGDIFILFILSVGASETAIGLSLVIAYHRQYT